MSYPVECDDRFTRCTRVPRYSNPQVLYNGQPTGIPFDAEARDAAWGVTGRADAASVIDVTAPLVAAWRDRPADTDQTTAAAALTRGQQPRNPGGIQAAPPAQPAGLFFDPLLAAGAPSAGTMIAPGVPQSPGSTSSRRRVVAVDFRQLGATV